VQTAEWIAQRATPAVLPKAEIDDEDDLDDGCGYQRDEESPIDNDVGDFCSQITDEDCLDVATHNRLMLEMLLGSHGQWEVKHRHEPMRMVAERE